MKETDLMIGDLTVVNKDGLCIKKNTIVEVRGIEADQRLELDDKCLIGYAHCRPLDDNQFEGGIWCEYLEPIPLTAEILEKNGFELYGNEWQYRTEDDKGHVLIEFSKDNKLSINIYNVLAPKDDKGRSDLVHFVRDWCDSFYVHELQHALRLCGIEKEIII